METLAAIQKENYREQIHGAGKRAAVGSDDSFHGQFGLAALFSKIQEHSLKLRRAKGTNAFFENKSGPEAVD